ncbi:uncharacterized protein [Littorina saxatilis]|uniref:uncharacterized protein isoform X2 n=1 Tax=Littorina saxatilis TaxID=31220 RepID=UPI0038B5F45B
MIIHLQVTMHTNAYNVFLSDVSKGHGLKCKEGSTLWKELPATDKQKYKEQAAHVRSSTQRKPAKLKNLIRRLLDELHQQGVESAVLLRDSNHPDPITEVFGRGPLGQVALNFQAFHHQISLAYNDDNSPYRRNLHAQREKVREHLNREARACEGFGKSFPHKKVLEGSVIAHGWPAGVKQRPVSSMSKKDMDLLLASHVKLERRRESDADPMLVQMQQDAQTPPARSEPDADQMLDQQDAQTPSTSDADPMLHAPTQQDSQASPERREPDDPMLDVETQSTSGETSEEALSLETIPTDIKDLLLRTIKGVPQTTLKQPTSEGQSKKSAAYRRNRLSQREKDFLKERFPDGTLPAMKELDTITRQHPIFTTHKRTAKQLYNFLHKRNQQNVHVS